MADLDKQLDELIEADEKLRALQLKMAHSALDALAAHPTVVRVVCVPRTEAEWESFFHQMFDQLEDPEARATFRQAFAPYAASMLDLLS